eukprot:scaffold453_cov187-Ochromonas_danica.AAC.26
MAKKTLFFGPLILWVCLSLIITHAWQGLPSRMYARHVNTAQLYAKKGGGGGGGGGGGYSPGARVPKGGRGFMNKTVPTPEQPSSSSSSSSLSSEVVAEEVTVPIIIDNPPLSTTAAAAATADVVVEPASFTVDDTKPVISSEELTPPLPLPLQAAATLVLQEDNEQVKEEVIPEKPITPPSSPSTPPPPPPPPPPAAEVTLKEQILAEASQSEERIQALSSLQAQIARSMARKNEIESTMATEIDQLRQSFFQEVLREKEQQDVLQQMKEISQKIIEKTVLDQLEGAIAKKASLIEIEEEVYREIDQCAIEVNQEISATKTKIMSLETVVRSLPEAGVDRIVYRSYSWQEVEQTQKALADYLIASSGREETIRALVSTMDRLLRRKGLVLGVNTVLPDDVAAAMPKRKQSVKEMNEEESRIYQPHIVKKYRKEEEEEGEEEEKENVPAMAIEGLKETTFSIGDVTSSLVDATGAFWTSEEGELSRQSFTSAVSSAQKVGSNIQAAWEAMKTSWESHSNDTSSIETTDQFFSKWVEAVKDVWTNRAAQEAWKEASKNSRESLVAAAKASQLTLDTISDELQQSEQWQNALGRFGSGLAKIVAAVVKGVEGLFVVDSLDRRLPSPKDPKGL